MCLYACAFRQFFALCSTRGGVAHLIREVLASEERCTLLLAQGKTLLRPGVGENRTQKSCKDQCESMRRIFCI